jgi:hypothetical protein
MLQSVPQTKTVTVKSGIEIVGLSCLFCSIHVHIKAKDTLPHSARTMYIYDTDAHCICTTNITVA